ncbi:MAG TPA: DUF4382 domain-containing protein [Steroidobacteraceae bacterium]|nr:DUF4382 domain-containing protein [Steroidobacteraceae bacterium]
MTAVRVRLPRRLLWASCALVLGAAALLAGCSTSNNIIYGTAAVTLSNSPGDFTSYIVNIDSITLTRNDGIIIEPLATPETVDLTQVHDLTELVEAPAFPVGTYTSMSVLLDYTVPYITVDVNGVPNSVAAVDSTGAAMGTVSLVVNFDPQNPLVINNQQSTRLALNFDLSAFNSLNRSASPITTTVVPLMTATPAPLDATPIRARGLLVISQPSSSQYIANIRPFNDVVSALGALTVSTSSSTYFNVNGTVYTGVAGLSALQSLPVNTVVAAYGTLGSLATITPGFNATQVYAASALSSPLADYLIGTVAAINGNTLTVQGVTFLGRYGGVQYYPQLPVTVSGATAVTEDGVAVSGLSSQSISVGQVVNVAGQAVGYPLTVATGLDATAGAVRLEPTALWGTLTSAAPGSMTLSLLSLGGFSGGAFNFAGTGSSSANDATFASYAVNTGAVDESGAAPGTLFEAFGNVAPFGSGPPDFTASSVSSPAPQQLVVEWALPTGSTAPFSSASSSGLVVNLANGAINPAVRYLATGPQKTDLTTLAASPTIVFASGTPTLAIGLSDTISIYNSAGAFATALATQLNGTNAAFRLSAVGQYDAATNTFTATQVAVNLVP